MFVSLPVKGTLFMKLANTDSSATTGGARTPAASTVGAMHLETSARELRLALSGLMLALTLAALDQNIVATALPRITGEFGSLQHLSWVVTSFILASTVSAPLYGKLSDLYGRKPAFIASISIFLAGSALCGFAASMGELIAFRTVQGLGAGGLIVLAQTVIGDLVSPRERGRYQGMFAAVFAACSVAGPLLAVSSPNTPPGAGYSTSICRSGALRSRSSPLGFGRSRLTPSLGWTSWAPSS
jgi:MFS family permease